MSATSLAAPIRTIPNLSLVEPSSLSAREIIKGRYAVRFARNNAEIVAALKLRYEVFNLELGAGLASSFLTGRDFDEFDLTSQHVILIDRPSAKVIGTYRVGTCETGSGTQGFPSSREFDLSLLPHEVLADAIEVGRVCLAKAHRNSTAQMLLWKGLVLGLVQNNKRHVLGFLSLATQDPLEAGRIFDQLSRTGHTHPEIRIRPRTGYKCLWYRMPEERPSELVVPSLFRMCLRLGTKLCGPPAINRQFRTIDFPVLLESSDQDRRRSI
jgi:putative hemolysin